MIKTLHQIELPWLLQLQAWRTPALDQFFSWLNFFDTLPFLLLLIPVVWYGYSREAGIKLFFILLLSGWLNHFLKDLFAAPRPGVYAPQIALFHFKSYGFPSGGAQQAMLLSGLFILAFRTWWAWLLGGAFFLLISFSRLYLGVHFPSDIVGGWLAGIFLLLIYYYIQPVWVVPFFIAAFLFFPGKLAAQILLMSTGLMMGMLVSDEVPAAWPVKLARIAVVIFGVGVLYFLPDMKWVAAWAIGFWVSCGGYFIK